MNSSGCTRFTFMHFVSSVQVFTLSIFSVWVLVLSSLQTPPCFSLGIHLLFFISLVLAHRALVGYLLGTGLVKRRLLCQTQCCGYRVGIKWVESYPHVFLEPQGLNTLRCV